MKIKELNTIGIGLRALGDLPIKGGLKFKVARNIKMAEDILVDAMGSITNEEDEREVMETKVDVEFLKFTEPELEPLEVDSKTIYMLLPIIIFQNDNKEVEKLL
jgi:hypothetical protein